VSVNGKTCWSKTNIVGTSGTQECGGFYKEERFPVTGCSVTLGVNEPLMVRVWTSLDSDAGDESFGIGNVVIQLLSEGYCGRELCSGKNAIKLPFTYIRAYTYTHIHIHVLALSPFQIVLSVASTSTTPTAVTTTSSTSPTSEGVSAV
jgi:hypothetical protein